MYDTIKFQIKHTPTQYQNLYQIIDKMDNVYENRPKTRETFTYSGRYKHWQFTLTPTNLICTGSIPQFLYDTNLVEMTLAEVNLVITELSNLLQMDIRSGRVTQLHYGHNLIMKQPVPTYFKFLANKSFTDRNVKKSSTLEFAGDGQGLIFYDKVAQLKNTNQKVRGDYSDKQVLRYELKLTQRIAQKLGRDVITVGDLSEEAIYFTIKEYWYNQYQTIDKLSYNAPQLGNNNKQLKEYLMLLGIKSHGLTSLFEEINILFKDSKAKNRAKTMIRTLAANHEKFTANMALIELEDKINSVMEILN